VSPLPGDHLAAQIRACIFERKWNGDRAELPQLKEKKIKKFSFFSFCLKKYIETFQTYTVKNIMKFHELLIYTI